MSEVTFTVGQRVIANPNAQNYGHQLTAGKEYIVTDFQPSVVDPTFTWPAYVTVIGDFGTPVQSHTYRFRPIEGA